MTVIEGLKNIHDRINHIENNLTLRNDYTYELETLDSCESDAKTLLFYCTEPVTRIKAHELLKRIKSFREWIKQDAPEVTRAERGNMNKLFNNLPDGLKAKVRETLKAFKEVYVSFEDGEYHVSTGIALRASYGKDHKALGTIKDEDIYTEEERTENYIECFQDYPIWYKGKRDYNALKARFEKQ